MARSLMTLCFLLLRVLQQVAQYGDFCLDSRMEGGVYVRRKKWGVI